MTTIANKSQNRDTHDQVLELSKVVLTKEQIRINSEHMDT